MNFLSTIFAGGVKEAFQGVGSLAKDIRSAITGDIDPEKKAEIQQQLMELEFTAQKTQNDINLQEAKHPNIFVSGWRPFIGWICGCALAYSFIGQPMLSWITQLWDVNNATPPILDIGNLMTLVLSMLGLGGMRTYEKFKKVNGSH